MNTIQWRGVFPAVTTKLKPDGSLDINAIGACLERLIEAGVGGVGGVVMMGMGGLWRQLLRHRREPARLCRPVLAQPLGHPAPEPQAASQGQP